MKYREIVRLIAGDADRFKLEHRVFNIFIAISMLISIMAAVMNYYLFLPLVTTVLPLVFFVVACGAYYMARIRGRFESPGIIMTICLVVGYPLLWYVNGGTRGGAQYTIVFLGILISIVFSGRLRTVLLACFACLAVTLVGIEFYYPEVVVHYSARLIRYVDVASSYTIAAVVTAVLFAVFADSYREERNKALEYSAKMEQIAITDVQTGIYNYRFIFQRLSEEINEADRYQTPLSVLMLDIDFFKGINDHYGHLRGDQILSHAASTIQHNLRASDIIGRYGGDEFLVICPQTTLDEAAQLGKRLIDIVAKTSTEYGLRVTISGGAAQWNAENPWQLVDRADRTLYTAKNNGRNRIEVSDHHRITG